MRQRIVRREFTLSRTLKTKTELECGHVIEVECEPKSKETIIATAWDDADEHWTIDCKACDASG